LSPFAAIWRQRWLALAVFVGVLLATGGWLLFADRTYTATATLTASPSSALLQSTGNFEELEATLGELANSRSVLEDVTARLSEPRTVDQLRNEVSGTHVNGTVLIRVTVNDASAQVAAEIANTVATVLPEHDPSGGMFVFAQTDPAHPPTTYSSPNTKIIALAGVALAILLGAGAALLYDALAGTVDNASQLATTTGTEVLAVLPRAKDLSELSIGDGATNAAAGLRSLRIALDIDSDDKPIGAIVVATVSADRRLGEWLAGNLAAALAQMHHTVLLIDGDLATPAVHPALTDDGSAGLYAVLRDEATVEEAARPGPVEGLTVLPAGDGPADTADSLVEMRLHKVLTDVNGRFDSVVVLAPSPTTLDVGRVMGLSGSLLLVVPARRVRVAALRRLTGQFEANRVRVLGAVLIHRARRFRA
jgi:polysaccharide biosynthesis transport protein